MADITDFIKKDMAEYIGYAASTSLDELEEKGIDVSGAIKLDANENPYGCSSKVKEALGKYIGYNIYPDAGQRQLKKLLANYTGASPQQIVAANGSDQLIDTITRLFVSGGDEVINFSPTFQMYEFSTRLCGGKVVVVKRDENFAIKTSMVKKAVTLKTKLIFITNPNAPSGNLTPQRDIEEILKIGLPTVIDEAYYEFCGQTALPLMKSYPNLMVIRTFSKWAGLAGLRMGYGVFSTALAKVVMKIKEPYSVSVAAQIAAKETFEDMVLQTKKIELIKTERERLYGQLKELGWLKPYPSVANFILCYIKDGRAKEITLALKQKGILVRYFERAELKDYLRISVGKPQETDILIKALREIGE